MMDKDIFKDLVIVVVLICLIGMIFSLEIKETEERQQTITNQQKVDFYVNLYSQYRQNISRYIFPRNETDIVTITAEYRDSWFFDMFLEGRQYYKQVDSISVNHTVGCDYYIVVNLFNEFEDVVTICN